MRRWISTVRAVELAAGDVALFAVEGGVGQEGVFRREPAARNLLLHHPARNAVLDHGGADNARVAIPGQDGAMGVRGNPRREGNRAGLVVRAAIRPFEIGHALKDSPKGVASKPFRVISRGTPLHSYCLFCWLGFP